MPKQYHKNPRQITKKQDADLEKSLKKFGDLSGIVHNLETDEVIGGNQRSRLFDFFRGNCEIVLTEEYDKPDEQGTVALGYLIWNDKKYSYRQVRWDEKTAEEANIRANKAGGTWDFDILADNFELDELIDWGFQSFELGLTDENDIDAEWEGMPEYINDDLTSAYSIKVHFATLEDMRDFAYMIDQPLTAKTKSIWHPRQYDNDNKSIGIIDEYES